MPTALDGMKVLDLTIGTAGPLAGMMLADNGAEVVRVTPATGDRDRDAAGYQMWNRNKSTVSLDVGDPAGRAALADLLWYADVVLVGGDDAAITHSRLGELGLSRPAGATWVVLPAYLPGDTPWAGGRESAGLLFAAMGHAWGQASYADVPVDCVYPVALLLQGVWAATVAVAAAAPGRGHGGLFFVGGAHGAVLASPGSFAISREDPHVQRPGGPAGSLPNYRCYRCRDGQWLFFGAFTGAFIRQGLQALGAGWLLADERLGGDLEAIRSPANFPWVAGALEQIFERHDQDHWLKVLEAADVPVSPVPAGGAWLDHPQVRALGLRVSLRDDTGSEWTMPGVPVAFSETPGQIRRLGRPLGEPLGGLVERWSTATRRPGSGAPDAPPLAGIRVIDLGTIIAGPFIGTLLGALGADVVKVERPPGGDEYRVAHGGRGGASFPAYNRGQRSIGLDLRSPGGADVLARLVKMSDVVVDNYRPGVAARLGVDWCTLREMNPQVSGVSVSAFGDAGPLGGRPGFDPVVQAMSGVMRTQGGDDENDSPAFLTVPVNDVIAATLGAFGACAALFARGRTAMGGQQVTVTLTAAAALLQAESLVAVAGRRSATTGGRDFRGPTPLSRLYPASDGWVRVDGRWPDDARRLAEAGLAPGWPDDQDRLEAALAAVIAGSTVAQAIASLTAATVPAVAARRGPQLLCDQSLRDHGILRAVTFADGDLSEVAAGRWYAAAVHDQVELAEPPAFGEHSIQILGELGYSAAECDALRERGEVVAAVTRPDQ